ncbi:S2539 protein, partial [Polypterus senegalus]
MKESIRFVLFETCANVMAVPATVVYFTCYDELCGFLKHKMENHPDKVPLLAGAVARVGSASVISPLELVRTKMQSQKLSYKELQICIQSAVASDGLLSLWRGLSATLLRDVPFSGVAAAGLLSPYGQRIHNTWKCSWNSAVNHLEHFRVDYKRGQQPPLNGQSREEDKA